MNWWGKIIGGTFGFMLGGPLGAMLGAVIGHNFDAGMQVTGGSRPTDWGRHERIQTAFFTATFSLLGHLCKVDGRVSEEEIAIVRQVMARMDLNTKQRQAAMALFTAGKHDNFPVLDVLLQLKQEIGRQANLQRMFIEIQLYAAYADGVLHQSEKRVLQDICEALGVSRGEYEALAAAIGGEMHHRQSAGPARTTGISLKDAYAVLNLMSAATDAEVKKSYRRLMNQHHPDKLVSKGLPEEMI
ncbi:MAG: Co-chaperone protein DjlA, partial [Gammaproteobacteria bacterium]|nr:Co-chaperone protein DjlA [Gammaproteobacteria bacterium]